MACEVEAGGKNDAFVAAEWGFVPYGRGTPCLETDGDPIAAVSGGRLPFVVKGKVINVPVGKARVIGESRNDRAILILILTSTTISDVRGNHQSGLGRNLFVV